MGWQDTERGQTGMATVMHRWGGVSFGALRGKARTKRGRCQGFDGQEFDKREQGDRKERKEREGCHIETRQGRTRGGMKRRGLVETEKKRKKALALLVGSTTMLLGF